MAIFPPNSVQAASILINVAPSGENFAKFVLNISKTQEIEIHDDFLSLFLITHTSYPILSSLLQQKCLSFAVIIALHHKNLTLFNFHIMKRPKKSYV